MEAIPYLALISALGGLALAFFFYNNVKAASPGDDRMVFLMGEIQKGARAFLKAEYTWVSVFALGMLILLAIVITPVASLNVTPSLAKSGKVPVVVNATRSPSPRP